MAEIGKGDPRWIVDDRVDGRNVNAWHWTERDCSKWCKDNLPEKLINLELCSYGGEGNVRTTKVEKVDGEFTYCNRKKKHMFFYDLDIKIIWEAKIADRVVAGHIRIPSLSEDEDLKNTDIRVATDAKSADGDELMKLIKSQAIPKLREILQLFLDETKEHFKEPLPDEPPKQQTAESANSSNQSASSASVSKPVVEEKPKSSGSSATKTIKSRLMFDSSPELMYECLVDDRRISAFTSSSAQMERKNGGKFSLFGGQIVGTNVELVPNQKIVQQWRFQSWPENHFSTVTISFAFKDRATEITLEQTKVPAADYERTKEGWNQHFWNRIRATFGYSFRIL